MAAESVDKVLKTWAAEFANEVSEGGTAESDHKVPKTGGSKSAILRGGSRVVGPGRAGPGGFDLL